MTLTSAGSTATLAQWQAAFRAVTYANSSDAPSTAARTVSYTINDGAASSNIVTSTINITAVNDAPVVVADSYSTVEDTPLSITASDLTTNDTDVDGGALTVTSVGGAVNGAVSLASGTITFTPTANYFGPASFTYTVEDGNGGSATGTVNVTVTAVNDASVLVADTATINEDTTATGNVLANDSDVDDVLTVSTFTVAGVAGTFNAGQIAILSGVGLLTIAANGDYTFTPLANWNGVVPQVTYTVSTGSSSTLDITVTPVNDAPTITSAAAVSVAENQTAATTVTATDPDAGATLSFSITGGADAALFAINSTTGVLTFNSAPNFETPADAGANNVYDVTVQVSDGTLTATQAIAVSVTNLNEPPTITSAAAVSVAENQTAATTVTATDPDAGATLSFSITGGADAALFAINSTTGVLTFNSAPNFETPADAGANNVYDVTVQVSDGTLTATQAIAVSVTNLNEPPTITSAAAVSVAENQTAATTVTATDPDAGATLSFSITGGADAALFAINSTTGVLTFNSAPNFETPADAGANNVYDVTVQVSDGTLTATQAIAVSVTNLNEPPTITSAAAVSVAENQTAATTVTATDPDAGATLSFSITGGADAALFAINSTTGVLTFNSAPNFETPADAGANNVYDVTVQVSDGTLTATQAIAVSVTNLNEPPTITSAAAVSVAENQTAATTVTATDPDAGATLSFSITGGADAALFAINSTTGVLTFNSAPNFETPADAGANNVYDVTVQVSDGTLTATQAIAVSVTNLNEPPTITSAAAVSVAENQTAATTVTATDPDAGATLSFSITGGADAALFAINSTTGVLTFNSAPNFETPADAGANNVYDVTVQVSDGTLTATQAIAVSVTNLNEPPTITSAAAVSVAENQTAATTVTATDPDAGATLSFSITGGADAALFAINSTTGVLTFNSAPNFETPADAGANNVYDVTVQVSDGTLTATQAIAVSVTNLNEPPTITSAAAVSVAENQTAATTVTATDPDAGATLSFSITGGADAALFAINSTTGVLTFNSAPNFETPADAGANNVYDVTVQVSDGTLTATQAIAVSVTNLNEPPTITSAAAVSVAENQTAATTVTATDPDAGATLSFSITGGADAALFAINSTTGVLTFNSAPNFETPADAGANNVYDVTVQVSDGTLTATQAIAVSVTNLNEPPTITSAAAVSVAENQTAATTVTATDPDAGATLSFSITGGADAALFAINSTTGVLTFNSAPNFETPADAGANNVYDVTVQVSDGTLTATQAIAVSVTNLNEPPTITSAAAVSVAENQTAATTVTATDPDAGATLSFSITGGADAALFAINSTTGVLTFNSAPNFETPADAGANNVYDVTVQVSDGTLTATQAIAVSVTNLNEPPTITSAAAVSVAENQTAATTVTATDPDAGATLSFSITGGADAALFAINSTTGVLTFNSAPNFETPADAGANNVYDVTVQVSDGTLTATQAIAVSVTNLNEPPTITSAAAVSVAENQTAATTVTATDPDAGATLSFSITGGADAALFAINSTTGVLTFNSAPNFETPADAGANNVYDVTVQVSDGTLTATQAIAVSVTNLNEPPTITSAAAVSVAENQTAATTVTATDPDAGATLSFSITGGADAALFAINSTTGVLTFNSAPNFETPADAGANNVYDVTVQVSDGTLTATQAIAVSVTNLNEPPTITSAAAVSVAENQTAATTVTATDPDAGATLSFSITGGADAALFAINSTTGVLTFNSAPNFETPADAGANNVYDVTVQVSDGTLTATQAIAVSVTNLNEPPTITSAAAVSVAENQTAATTVTATDPDAGATLSFSITGGADAALFAINSTTGVLTFNSAPNFETPADAGANNVYDVTVQVSDGTLTATQAIAVSVTNLNEPPTITSAAAVSVAENQTAATTVTATDPDAGATLSFSITGGADAALFAINSTTGVLTFNSAPNFETPADAGANNVYDVTVQVSDGTLTATQAIAVSVTNLNEPPTITSAAAVSVAENQTAATTVTATDPDAGATLSFSITGGADAALFAINSTTGVLTFNSAPNFETPADAGANNVYDVTVQVSDGTLTATQAIAVSVTNLNEPPTITSAAAVSVAENQTAATTVTATDPDAGATLSFSITGGADAALFAINSTTGVLTFNSAPNFETPADAGANNVYDVTVQVSDGTLTATQAIAVSVTNLNEPPTITSAAAVSVAENQTAATTVTATDPDAGATLSFSITGGADAALFAINSTTGVLTFNSAPNFETPADAGANNVYDVTVQVSDGTLTATQAIAVSVTNLNEPPTITSAAAVSVAENQTAATTVTATDPDAGATLSFSITGGADAALFAINSTTGVLTFNSAPNFETPADAGANNVYDVTVQVSDGTLTATQAIAVSVTNLNEPPTITSAAAVSVAENQTAATTVTATDPDAGATLSFSITGGADAALFAINSTTGVLTFNSAPNFETPADAGANNVYDVTVQVSDGTLTATQAIAVSVTNLNEPPTITSAAAVSVAENQTAATTVTATDPDAGATLSFSITGGADAALFAINSTTGVLTFNSAPNFETPADAGANNVYDVTVQVSDGTLTATQAIAVSVTNLNEPPTITSAAAVSVAENQTAATTVTATDPDAGATLSFSITGGADAALFAINSTTGVLTFNSAPNFETPADAGANNVYDVTVQVSDGTLTATQAIAVSVTNLNEPPTITSAAAVSVAENQTAATTVTATDPDAGATLSFSITGGADAALFAINSTTGVLTFNSAPNFETPADAGANNVYDVTVQVSDGTLTATQAIAVSVTNVNEPPTITSAAAVSVAENQTAATTVTATDPDAGATLSFSITGGADAALFAINSTTGVLTFNSAPNFETPADAGANNVYDVTVQVSDGTLTATQAIAVSVTNVNEPPTITSAAAVSVAENQTAATTVTATDPDAGATLSFSITGGADAALFAIDSTTGVLTFNSAPNFETPTDAGANNVYDVIVQVSDGTLTATQAIAVTVTNLNEPPMITSAAAVERRREPDRRHHRDGHRSGRRRHAQLLDHRRRRCRAVRDQQHHRRAHLQQRPQL